MQRMKRLKVLKRASFFIPKFPRRKGKHPRKEPNMKDLKLRIPMNLQFFAEGEENVESSENVSEVADQTTGEGEVSTETESAESTEEVTEPQFDTEKANAAFANMRRQLEAANKRQRDIDSMYARQYGQYTNPETGQPIRSAEDYFNAMAAQERMNARAQMQASGIDPSLIDNMINNSPVIRQAQEATAELNNIRSQQMLEEDFKEVLKLDPSLTSVEDIVNDPNYAKVVDYCMRVPGVRFTDAYKIVNFDKLSTNASAAAKQQAINQVKSKNHLATGTAINADSGLEDIPADQIDKFQNAFPGRSAKELKALYNKALKARKG